jgi:multiple sugar transport system substrate-binding protein
MASALLLAGCRQYRGQRRGGGDERRPPRRVVGGGRLRWRTRPDNQAEIDLYQQISDNWTARTTPSPSSTSRVQRDSSYQDVLKTEIAAGTAPDVFWIPGTDVADFAKRG